MTSFNDREKAFENLFAHDQELQFKVEARSNKLLAEWAAEKLRLSLEEVDGYVKDVIKADFEEPGKEDVVRKVSEDFDKAGVEISQQEIREQIGYFFNIARDQIMEEE